MKLPNTEDVLVEHEKIADYLLNPAQSYGASNARFFFEFGFRADAWEASGMALREHGQRHEIRRVRETPFGPRYEMEGGLTTPDGRNPLIRTVWQLDQGQIAPRLTTAYPLERNYD